MSGMLKSLAVQSVNKGKPSSFYAGEKTNPVLQALASDIRQFQNLIIKKNSKAYKPAKDEASSRAYVVLCHNYMYFASVAHCARKFSNLRLCAYDDFANTSYTFVSEKTAYLSFGTNTSQNCSYRSISQSCLKLGIS